VGLLIPIPGVTPEAGSARLGATHLPWTAENAGRRGAPSPLSPMLGMAYLPHLELGVEDAVASDLTTRISGQSSRREAGSVRETL